MKKRVLHIFAVAIMCVGVLFVSCGSDDSKKLTPQEQLNSALTKAVIGNMETFAEGLSQTKNAFDVKNFGNNIVLSVSIGDSLRPMVKALLDDEDLDVNTDWFNSVQLSLKTVLNDNAMQFKVKAGLNNTDIISVNLMEDSKNAMAYFSIPELTTTNFSIKETDIGYTAKELINQYLREVEFLSSIPDKSVFTGLSKELLNAVLAPLNNVSRSKATVNAGLNDKQSVAAEYTVLSVVLNEAAGAEISKSLCTAIKDSSNARTLAAWFADFYSKQYGEKPRTKDIIDSIVDELEYSLDDLFYYNDVNVDFYVDAKSNLIGTRVEIEDEGVILAAMPQSGKAFGYTVAIAEGNPSDINFSNISNRALAVINGYGSYTGGKMTGDFKVMAEGDDILSFETKNLDIAALKAVKTDGSITIHPTSYAKDAMEDYFYYYDDTFTSLADNIDLQINMTQKDRDSVKYEVVLLNENSPYCSYSVSSTNEKPVTDTFPTANVVNIDEDSVSEYEDILKTIDTSAVVSNLRKAKVADEYLVPLEGITTDALMDLVEDYVGGGSYYDDYYDYDYDYDYDDYWW